MKSFIIIMAAFGLNAFASTTELKQCEDGVRDLLKGDWREILISGRRGFAQGAYREGGSLSVSLVLETQKSYYFYFEACDICAELVSCEKGQTTAKSFKTGHLLDCSDLPSVGREDVLYSDCH